MNPDGLSYLDMASETVQSGPHNLVNLSWSPLYPFLIALFMFLFRPTPEVEVPSLHFLNWLIFVTTELCFVFFLRTWCMHKQDFAADEEDSPRYGILVPFAFWLFFWCIIQFIPISLVTPDLCVAGIVFLAAGICSQLSRPTSGWKHYFALGVILSSGYYAKAAMFPAALLLLLLLFLWPPSASYSRYRVLAAAVTFVVASAPLVFLMTKQAGHLSFSESGSMNYAWWVNRVPPYAGLVRLKILDSLYTGRPGKSAMVIHSPRILMEKPLTLEFGSPVGGTHPLWYDPGYWNEGAKARFDLRQQIVALKENILKYGRPVMEMCSLCAGAIVLWLLGLPKPALVKSDRKWHWLLLWPLAVGAMYTCIHVEYRYVGAFFVVFWLAAYGAIIARTDRAVGIAVLATVLGSLITSTIGSGTLSHFAEHKPPDYLVIADGLRKLGVRPGDRLATVGTMIDAYYARPARVRIIAQISGAEEFWSLSAGDFKVVKERLASIGIKALIAKDAPPGSGSGDWEEIPGTRSDNISVLILQPLPRVPAFPGALRPSLSNSTSITDLDFDTAATRTPGLLPTGQSGRLSTASNRHRQDE